MAVPDLVNLSALIDDAKCFALVRQHRWPEGVHCPACGSGTVVRDGFDETQAHRQRYRCKACTGRFDDLTGTVLAGHHQPLRVWVLCLYFMGLNLSNRQIAQELGLDGSDVQAMTEQLRRGLVAKIAPVRLEGEVEIDEVYVVAGHKGQPAAVAKGGGSDAAAGWRYCQATGLSGGLRHRYQGGQGPVGRRGPGQQHADAGFHGAGPEPSQALWAGHPGDAAGGENSMRPADGGRIGVVR